MIKMIPYSESASLKYATKKIILGKRRELDVLQLLYTRRECRKLVYSACWISTSGGLCHHIGDNLHGKSFRDSSNYCVRQVWFSEKKRMFQSMVDI